MMTTMPSETRHSVFTFVKKGLTEFEQTASLLPSQRFLVNAMIDAAEPEQAKVVVELGPGSGPMTGPLLRRMRSDARLFTIEIDPELHAELKENERDPRATHLLGSAEDIGALLAANGHAGKVDVVFSSLGLSLIPDGVRERILESASAALDDHGVYTQFGYFHTRYLAWTRKTGLVGFDYMATLRRHFATVTRWPVAANLPPAWVYRARPRVKG